MKILEKEDQKLRRLKVCLSHKARNSRSLSLNRIIICDKKWILYDNRIRSGQWLNVNENFKQMAKTLLRSKKVMMIT